MSAENFFIPIEYKLISSRSLGSLLDHDAKSRWQEYLNWMLRYNETPFASADFSTVKYDFTPKILSKSHTTCKGGQENYIDLAPCHPLLPLLAAPYLAALYFATKDRERLDSLTIEETKHRQSIIRGYSELMKIIIYSSLGQVSWENVKRSNFPGSPLRNVQYASRKNYSTAETYLDLQDRTFGLSWKEVCPLEKQIAPFRASSLISEMRLSVFRTGFGQGEIIMDFEVNDIPWFQVYNGNVRWGIPQNLIDTCIGYKKHHIKIASGDRAQLYLLQRRLLGMLGLYPLYQAFNGQNTKNIKYQEAILTVPLTKNENTPLRQNLQSARSD